MVATVILVLMVLLGSMMILGYLRFNHLVQTDKNMLFNLKGNTEKLVTEKDMAHLPQILKSYLIKVGVLNQCRDCHITFKQVGSIRQKPNAKWTQFTAKQYMTADVPGFVWHARSFPMFIRDKSINGTGEIMVSLFGLKKVAMANDGKIAQSALCRCLSELPLYPIGFLSPLITYNVNEDNSLTAVLEINGTVAESTFSFNSEGLIHQIKAERYKDDVLENFTGYFENYQKINALYVPTKMKAVWNLKKEDFEYFNCEITDYAIN
ncbi:MAG: hypothetical protein HKP38_05925 [Croceitalea sp.]|nr:hypothetical protein [Croceitalea sp.]